MSEIPGPEILLVCCALFAVAAYAIALFARGSRPPQVTSSEPARGPEASLDDAVDLLRGVIAEQNDPLVQRAAALDTLEAREDAISPPEAIGLVRKLLPASSPGLHHQLLMERWRATGSRPILAAIAGLSCDPTRNQISSLGLHEAWDKADAGLLRYLAGFVEAHFDDLDDWFGASDTIFRLEAAAQRMVVEDAALSARLRVLALRVEARSRVVLLEHVQRAVARYFVDVSDDEYAYRPRDLAMGMGMLCVPRFPELVQAAHATFNRQLGADWDLAGLVLDMRIIEEFGPSDRLAGFDFESSEQRFYDALTAHDEGLSEDAAFILVGLIEEGYFRDWKALLSFRQAMDWTANLHWPRPDGHLRLLELLAKTIPET